MEAKPCLKLNWDMDNIVPLYNDPAGKNASVDIVDTTSGLLRLEIVLEEDQSIT